MAKITRLAKVLKSVAAAPPSVAPPKRKRGRPSKATKEAVGNESDYRLKPVTDQRLLDMKKKVDELPIGSTQWEAARREYFGALLDVKLSVEDRADLIIALAKKDDAKSAPVALRAIQDINEATRLKDAGSSTAPSIFVLPAGTQVATLAANVVDTTATVLKERAALMEGERPQQDFDDERAPDERW